MSSILFGILFIILFMFIASAILVYSALCWKIICYAISEHKSKKERRSDENENNGKRNTIM